MANEIAPLPMLVSSLVDESLPATRAGRFVLDDVSDDALHTEVKSLTGRHNSLTAELLAHLAEVDARGIYRERACSSLYTYCVYELRLSEDEAQRRARAAKTARAFPILLEMLAEGAIHLTGLLLLAPHLTPENHAGLLALARFRTKREIEHLVAEIAPRPEVPGRVEPLGPRPARAASSWRAFWTAVAGPVRELVPGVGARQVPPAVFHDGNGVAMNDAGVGVPRAPAPDPEALGVSELSASAQTPGSRGPVRYRVEFTASERYVELLEEARNLLQHRVPNRDVARVHELALEAFVEQLRKRRQAASKRPRNAASAAPGRLEPEGPAPHGSAPARMTAVGERPAPAGGQTSSRHVPAPIRREVWRRDAGQCTFADASGRRCVERAGLEIHHVQAFALGGPATMENLRLVCRAHNALFAEKDFGRERIEHLRIACRERDG